MNRTLVEKARAMMAASNITYTFWAEAIANATHARNRSPTSSLKKHDTVGSVLGHKPSENHLRTFVCIAYAHIAEG